MLFLLLTNFFILSKFSGYHSNTTWITTSHLYFIFTFHYYNFSSVLIQKRYTSIQFNSIQFNYKSEFCRTYFMDPPPPPNEPILRKISGRTDMRTNGTEFIHDKYHFLSNTRFIHSFIYLRCKIRLYMQKYNTITNTIRSISRHNNTYKYIICLVRKGMEVLYCHPCWSIQILFPFCHRLKNKAS